ncbi:farnesyl cysteine-carboxyl methyltransferase [Coemansia sp. RSA 1972]|nr:farnesyl cysteine-carboxyl methyltransferase [Coemansia sp. RSA 1972]
MKSAREEAFGPNVGQFRRQPTGPQRWYTPVAAIDTTHTAHNIALTACALGIAMGAGLSMAYVCGWSTWGVFGMYVVLVSTYHMLEYLSVALYNPERLEMGSFMFNPDVDNGYIMAMGLSLVEYAVGYGGRTPGIIAAVGLGAAVAGQIVRTLAMVTAKTSFNHYVATRQVADHSLVTHGIYAYERHPSYVGFYVWSVGLQVMLQNVCSAVLFSAVLGYFFVKRTKKEELFLTRFFGHKYLEYRNQTRSLIPVWLTKY